MSLSYTISLVDAFTTVPFKGNQAAVCVLTSFAEDELMQNIAMEMNVAETAFLVKTAPLHYHLRWFTPAMEVNLCGHATLAAMHVLFDSGAISVGDTVTFETKSGRLTASAEANHSITLDFPALPGTKAAAHASMKSLGPVIACEKNRDNYLAEVKDYTALLACSPDFRALHALDMQGVIVTTATGVPEGYDFASRYFAPAAGIDEDPVTGSAHCFLAPYWAKKLSKNSFRALQASKRTGTLDVSLQGDRVRMTGHAVTTLTGIFKTHQVTG